MTKQFLQAIPHVESLNMEANLLKTLKKETFFPTRKMIKLNLNGNKIQDWFQRTNVHHPGIPCGSTRVQGWLSSIAQGNQKSLFQMFYFGQLVVL